MRVPVESPNKQRQHQVALLFVGATALFLCLGSFTCLYGQVPDNIPDVNAAEKIKFSFEASPIYAPKTHVSGGGNITLTSYMATAKASMQVNETVNAGLGLSYEFDDYNFTPLTTFAVADPWNKIHKVGVNGRIRYSLSPKWGLTFAPMVQYAAEEGAHFGRSIIYGGAAGATYTSSPNFTIGLAAAVFYRIEETVLFPTILIDWKINDRLRLTNPYRMGPAGPAGLELGYKLGNNWEIALGGGYRSSRFRLSQSGPVPGGVGQTNAVIGYLNLSRHMGKHFYMSLYGGAAFAGSIRIEDRTGERIDSTSYSTAPIMGLILAASF